jgi:hypothetical protein
MLIGHGDGVGSMRWDGKAWIDEGRLPNTVYGSRGLVEDAQGSLWVSGGDGKVLRVEVAPTGMRDSKVQIISRNEGLIEGNTHVGGLSRNRPMPGDWVSSRQADGTWRVDGGSLSTSEPVPYHHSAFRAQWRRADHRRESPPLPSWCECCGAAAVYDGGPPGQRRPRKLSSGAPALPEPPTAPSARQQRPALSVCCADLRKSFETDYQPLVAQERVLGVLSIQSFKKNAYTEQHLSLLENLAAYTTIALDNANAYLVINEREHEVSERAGELVAINRITQALATQLDKGSPGPVCWRSVRDFVPRTIAEAMLAADRATMVLEFPYAFGEDARPDPSVGITSQIIRTGQPLLINEDMNCNRAKLGIDRWPGDTALPWGSNHRRPDHRCPQRPID